MRATLVRRSQKLGKPGWVILILASLLVIPIPRAGAGLGARHPDPAQVIPLDQLAPEQREVVSEVIREHSFHRDGEPETFPCNGNLYLSLLNEPSCRSRFGKT